MANRKWQVAKCFYDCHLPYAIARSYCLRRDFGYNGIALLFSIGLEDSQDHRAGEE